MSLNDKDSGLYDQNEIGRKWKSVNNIINTFIEHRLDFIRTAKSRQHQLHCVWDPCFTVAADNGSNQRTESPVQSLLSGLVYLAEHDILLAKELQQVASELDAVQHLATRIFPNGDNGIDNDVTKKFSQRYPSWAAIVDNISNDTPANAHMAINSDHKYTPGNTVSDDFMMPGPQYSATTMNFLRNLQTVKQSERHVHFRDTVLVSDDATEFSSSGQSGIEPVLTAFPVVPAIQNSLTFLDSTTRRSQHSNSKCVSVFPRLLTFVSCTSKRQLSQSEDNEEHFA